MTSEEKGESSETDNVKIELYSNTDFLHATSGQISSGSWLLIHCCCCCPGSTSSRKWGGGRSQRSLPCVSALGVGPLPDTLCVHWRRSESTGCERFHPEKVFSGGQVRATELPGPPLGLIMCLVTSTPVIKHHDEGNLEKKS